jgi:polyisoprenoid-binding protein YceI
MKQGTIKNQFFALTVLMALSPAVIQAEVAQAGNYKLDPSHTNIQFSVSHLGFSNLIGRFNEMSGKMKLDKAGKSSVEVVINTNSVDSNHKKRDAHLRGPDFFNVKQFPEIKFVSSKVTLNKKGEPTSIAGKLSMHGKTHEVVLDVSAIGAGKDPWGGYRSGYVATTTVKRADYGMNYMPGGIGADVKITLDVEFIKQ